MKAMAMKDTDFLFLMLSGVVYGLHQKTVVWMAVMNCKQSELEFCCGFIFAFLLICQESKFITELHLMMYTYSDS